MFDLGAASAQLVFIVIIIIIGWYILSIIKRKRK